MTGMKKKKLISNFITYGIVIIAFIIVQIMQSTGNLSSMMTGLLVPLCVYVVLAVSLNLVVGISGELSLGHAGFMCIGAFAGAFFSKCTQNTITVGGLRFFLALLIGAAFAALFGLLIGIPVLRLNSGNYRNTQGCVIPGWNYPDPGYSVCCAESDRFQRWTRHQIHPR